MTNTPPHREQQDSNPRASASSSVRVPPTVYAQLEALRKSGIVNMYTEVHAGLSHFEFDEARQWLESNPDRYQQGFNHGFDPTDPDAVDPIDPQGLIDSLPEEPPARTRDDATFRREKELLDHLESLRRFSDEADAYYRDGSWRGVAPLTNEELELAEEFIRTLDCRPQQSYRNALLTAATYGQSHDLVYVEGYVRPSSSTVPVAHAWVELNGKVVELTLPDGPDPSCTAAYLGIEFSAETAREKILEDGVAEPLVQ
jgi:hypothetical protein